jgi:spore germination protein GerM
VDANENMLVETYAEADGEWMTDSFVPFRMEFDIPEPTTRTGVLILKNANASGLPDRAMELRIPLKFHLRNDSPQHITFFFYSEKDLEDAFVSSPVEITRLTDAHLDPIDAILRAMFSEPREHEYAQGARSSEDLYALDEYYLGVSIENRIATIDFADNALSILNSTATRQLMAKDLVEHTLKSQPSIDSVQYSIEGEVWTEWDA